MRLAVIGLLDALCRLPRVSKASRELSLILSLPVRVIVSLPALV